MNNKHVWDIICFTIADNLKKKSLYITTLIIAIICLLALPVFAYISMSPNKDKKDDSKIEKIYILDETGYGNVDYETLKGLDKDYEKTGITLVNKSSNSNENDNSNVSKNDKSKVSKKKDSNISQKDKKINK